MNLFELFEGSKGNLLTAGFFGSAVAAIFEWRGVLPTLRKIAVGTITAYYLGPIGVPLFQWAGGMVNIPMEPSASVGGFVMGIGGMTIVELIVKIWRFRLHELPQEVNHDETDR